MATQPQIGDVVAWEIPGFEDKASGTVISASGNTVRVRRGMSVLTLPASTVDATKRKGTPIVGRGYEALRNAKTNLPERYSSIADALMYQIDSGNPKIGNKALAIITMGDAEQIWRLMRRIADRVEVTSQWGDVRRAADRVAEDMPIKAKPIRERKPRERLFRSSRRRI